MFRRVVFLVLVATLTVFALTGCNRESRQADGPRTVLRLATIEPFTMIDPHYNTRAVDNALAWQVFEGFYYVTPFGDLEPRLATRFEISPDNLTYTYYLKRGVQFQNGNPMTAADVVFSFERALAAPPMQAAIGMVTNVEALDDYTVRVTLSDVNPMFHANGNIAIMCRIDGANVQPGFFQPNIGTGPYFVSDWGDGMRVVKDRNPTWHMQSEVGLPQIERQVRYVVTDNTTALMALEADDIDYFGIPAPDWVRIRDSGNFTTLLQQSWHTTYMVFNTTRAPFDDVRVRQAFNYAVNRYDVAAAAMEGLADVAYFMGNPYYITHLQNLTQDPNFERYDHNPARARQLLAEAGYPNGMTLNAPIVMRTLAGSHFTTAAEVIQQQLAQVGVNIAIEIGDPATYFQDITNGNYYFDVAGWSWTTFDAFWIERRFSSYHIDDANTSSMVNPEVDRLFRVAGTTANQDVRRQAFRDAMIIVQREAPIIPLYYQMNRIAWHPKLIADPNRPIFEWYWVE